MLRRILRLLERRYFGLYQRLPMAQSRFVELEALFACKQGKGWGAGSIAEEVSACAALLSKEPGVFIDVGANKGVYTTEVLNRFPRTNCFLFEPSTCNLSILRGRFKESSNVSVYDLALSDRDGTSMLFADSPGSGLSSLVKRRLDHFGIPFEYSESVNLVRFDHYWGRNSGRAGETIDWVKVDVEGHELCVLHGFGELIHNVRIIQFEFGGCNIDTRTYFQDFWYFFKDKGFGLYRVSPAGPVRLDSYHESDEFFSTTNYIAVNLRT